MSREVVWKGDLGEGTVFYRLVDGRRASRNLYLSYRAGGRERILCAKTEELQDAKNELRRLLRNRENAKEGLEPLILPKTERITVAQLLDANLARVREKGLADERRVRYRSETLKRLVGGVRAVEFRAEHVDRYKDRRRKGEGRKDGKLWPVSETAIRHELEVLEAAFRYAQKRGTLRLMPYIEKPTEDNVREVEIPRDRVLDILAALGRLCPDVRDFVEWLVLTARRPKGTRALRWDWFDAKAWVLRVPGEKGGNAVPFSIEGSLRAVIERRLPQRLRSPFVFSHKGKPLGEDRTRRIFYAALEACGLPTGKESGFVLYDGKKTAAGLLIDSGLSEREAMDFSGHKTPSMFDRYVIKTAERHGGLVRKRDKRLAQQLAPAADRAPTTADRVARFSRKR